jgi:hAT family C-terminal dimerisation region
MDYEVMAPLAMQYQTLGINCDRLNVQVTLAKEMLTKASLKDPEDVLDLVLSMKTAFPDLALFGQLVLTMPVSANAERSFSALKRVKTYLRSTMAEHRLKNLCIMSVERELSSSFLENINPVLDKFANMKNRRANLLNK